MELCAHVHLLVIIEIKWLVLQAVGLYVQIRFSLLLLSCISIIHTYDVKIH